jgi:hypothetical protein
VVAGRSPPKTTIHCDNTSTINSGTPRISYPSLLISLAFSPPCESSDHLGSKSLNPTSRYGSGVSGSSPFERSGVKTFPHDGANILLVEQYQSPSTNVSQLSLSSPVISGAPVPTCNFRIQLRVPTSYEEPTLPYLMLPALADTARQTGV